MLNEGTNATTLATMAAGTTVSAAGAAVSWMDHVEQIFRMGSTAVSIVSGLVVIVVAIRSKKKKDKEE